MNGRTIRMLPYVLAFFSSLCIMILELVASRLVARHVGASLSVWTSVIGIMLGGICLGNVLGGRLADRVEPGRAIGPLYALGAFLTLSCLWMNAVVGLTPGLGSLPWGARTVVVVTLDFLIPATVLGMIGPVVATMAVDRKRPGSVWKVVGWKKAEHTGLRYFLFFAYVRFFASIPHLRVVKEPTDKSGTAIGDVYFMGAVGSIVGTFLAGFILMYVTRISSIVTVVAAALALLSALLIGERRGLALGLLAAGFLGLGSINPLVRQLHVGHFLLGSTPINYLALPGHVLTIALALEGAARLWGARLAPETPAAEDMLGGDMAQLKPSLADLAVLSFVASLAFMALEMVAGRLVTRHLGSSIYGWTSVIGVLLGGLSLGNYLGGKFADHVHDEKSASWLFLVASVLTILVLLLEKPPQFIANHLLDGDDRSVLSYAITWTEFKTPGGSVIPLRWPARVLLVTTFAFFLPSLAMGTVSPVVAKLAVERVRRSKRTGTAIGQVYAWGMVGSIVGTFLTGFVLIDWLGTKGVLLVLGAGLAFAATYLGSIVHAAWAGIPLGLCVIAFMPSAWLVEQGKRLGIREERGDPQTTEDAVAYVDESNYYYIKVTNEADAEGRKRTLVLDNLIHGYFVLDHPERLDYDYEHIYALVAHRVAQARKDVAGKGKGGDPPPMRNLFLGGGAYTFQRYMQHTYPGTEVDVAEIDPAVTRANHIALGLPKNTPIQTSWGDARQFVEKHQDTRHYDIVFGDAFNDFSVPWHLTTREFNEKLAKMLGPDGVYMINIIDAYESDAKVEERVERRIKKQGLTTEAAKRRAWREERAKADSYGGFLGAWVNTARETFGKDNVFIFGTDDTPGGGLRETFVVVASKAPLDLDDLGSRDDDPKFFEHDKLFEPRPFPPEHIKAIDRLSRGIILTDDYAPVENLLAPVAETRGED